VIDGATKKLCSDCYGNEIKRSKKHDEEIIIDGV
jgi:hypothetical protein